MAKYCLQGTSAEQKRSELSPNCREVADVEGNTVYEKTKIKQDYTKILVR